MLIKRCNDCNHRDICKHKNDYDKIVEDITVKVPEPFTLMLNCKHYYSSATYLTAGGDDYIKHCYDYTNVAKPYLTGGPEVVY
jgi:hypothetical protein